MLLVDFEPAGLVVGRAESIPTPLLGIFNLLLSRDTSIDEVIDETNVPGLRSLPSNIDLSAAEIQLV